MVRVTFQPDRVYTDGFRLELCHQSIGGCILEDTDPSPRIPMAYTAKYAILLLTQPTVMPFTRMPMRMSWLFQTVATSSTRRYVPGLLIRNLTNAVSPSCVQFCGSDYVVWGIMQLINEAVKGTSIDSPPCRPSLVPYTSHGEVSRISPLRCGARIASTHQY